MSELDTTKQMFDRALLDYTLDESIPDRIRMHVNPDTRDEFIMDFDKSTGLLLTAWG